MSSERRCHRRDAELRARPHAAGVGAQYKLVFVDRMLATLVHLRHSPSDHVVVSHSTYRSPGSSARFVRHVCDTREHHHSTIQTQLDRRSVKGNKLVVGSDERI